VARRREETIKGPDVELNYSERGEGPPLLLLHGVAARWQVFGPLIPRLSQDWRVVAMDFRGHGKSGRTPGDYTIEAFAADALAVLDQVIGGPAVVYGHSLGGWAAIWIAAHHPELVQGLIIGDSALYAENIDPTFAVSYLADMPIALRSMATSLEQLDPNVLEELRSRRMITGYDAGALLPRVGCPTLLLQADPELDGIMRDDDVEQALALIPDARHRRFDGVGHGLHVQDAEAVLGAVEPFLSSLKTSP
jgi:pimeloyl-ACP methyl ester carboxylesterase